MVELNTQDMGTVVTPGMLNKPKKPFAYLQLGAETSDHKGQLTNFTVSRESAATFINPSGVLTTADGDGSGSASSIMDETGFTGIQGSFVDDQAWLDGEVLGSTTITNGDNESAVVSHAASRGTLAQSAEQAYGGSYSAKWVNSALVGKHYARFTPNVSTDTLYKIIVYVYLPSGQTTSQLSLVSNQALTSVLDSTTETDKWVKLVGYHSSGVGWQAAIIGNVDDANAEFWYIDDISVQEVTSKISDYATTGDLVIAQDSSGNSAYGFLGAAGTGEAFDNGDLFDANKGTFTESALLGSEAITAQNDRDFSSGTIGNWVVAKDGSGTCTYDNTNLSFANESGDDKQGLLTSSGDSFLQAKLTDSYWSPTASTLHKMTAKLAVPAANTNKTVEIRYYDGSDLQSTFQTLSGDTWTDIVLYFYTAASAAENIYVMFHGSPTDGDLLYFDDISIKPIDISWTPYGTNTIEIDSDALKISYVDNANGAYLFLKNSTDFSADMEVGKYYKLTGQAKVGSGDSVDIEISCSGADPSVTITDTSYVPFELYFIATRTQGDGIRMANMGAGESIWLDNLVLTEVTEPPVTAAHVFKEYALTNEGWNAIDSGFDYNDITAFDVYANKFDEAGIGSATDTPRIEANGLLHEGEATNWCLYSNDFEVTWQTSGTFSIDSTNNPDPKGTNTATAVSSSAANDSVYQTFPAGTIEEGGSFTFSMYIKGSGGPIELRAYEVGADYTVYASNASISPTSSWTRYSISGTKDADGNVLACKLKAIDGASNVMIFGAQLEATPYPTSYIPTTTIPVTRTADTDMQWTMSTAFKNLMGNVADSPFTMVVEWTPGVSYGNVGSEMNIITPSGNMAHSFLANPLGRLYADDGPSQSYVDTNYAADTTYIYALRVYDNSGMYFEVGEKHGGSWSWDGSAADYNGSFTPSTDLTIGYNNPYPFNIKNICFFNEAKSQAWIEANF